MTVQFMLEFKHEIIEEEKLGDLKIVDKQYDWNQPWIGYEIIEVEVHDIGEIKIRMGDDRVYVAEKADQDKNGAWFVTVWAPAIEQEVEQVKKIQLKTIDVDGNERFRTAKSGVTIGEVEDAMERMVLGGHAVYAAVIVDDEVYAELET